MARVYYHYTITILEKVSFDASLFKKELEKAEESLLEHEKSELQIWLQKFFIKHPDLLVKLKEDNEFNERYFSKVS